MLIKSYRKYLLFWKIKFWFLFRDCPVISILLSDSENEFEQKQLTNFTIAAKIIVKEKHFSLLSWNLYFYKLHHFLPLDSEAKYFQIYFMQWKAIFHVFVMVYVTFLHLVTILLKIFHNICIEYFCTTMCWNFILMGNRDKF